MSPQLQIVKVSRTDGTSETKTVFKCTSWELKDVLACINELAGGKKIFRNIYLTLAFNNATCFHFVNFSCRNKKQYKHCTVYDNKKWQFSVFSTHLESHYYQMGLESHCLEAITIFFILCCPKWPNVD